MERIKTIATRDLTKSVQTGGCGVRNVPLDAACAGRHFFVLYGGEHGTPV